LIEPRRAKWRHEPRIAKWRHESSPHDDADADPFCGIDVRGVLPKVSK